MKKVILAFALLTLAITLVFSARSNAASGRCPQYEQLLVTYAPKGGWNVKRMSGYMWRESRCTPNVRSSTRDSGLLQINDINHKYLTQKLNIPINAAALMDPTTNIKAAAKLCEYARRAWGNCYQPWRL